MFRDLWENLKDAQPRLPRGGRAVAGDLDPLKLPTLLQTGLQALYGHYEKTFNLWRDKGIKVPPCFIIVCQNTAISKLVFDFISGFHRTNEDGTTTLENGRLALFRNFDEVTGNPLPRPNTLLIDSEQLEAGDALDDNFRSMAADEIERFRREIVERSGDMRSGDNITDQDLLREVMNTVGKVGQLGGSIRCVVCLRSANRSDRELHAGSRDPIRPRRQRARNPPTRTSLGGALHSNSRLSASMYSVAGASFTMAMICPASAGDQLVQPLLRPLAYSSSCPNGTYPSRSA